MSRPEGASLDDRHPRRRRPTPVDLPRPQHVDELFISTTDRKGIIELSNEVFVRISDYREDELYGRAHNVIRHPDMPRAAFRVFWQHLEAEQPVAAYVKNLAADGRYYWVTALAVPVGDAHISVRLKPTTELFDATREIYRDVLAAERAVEAGDLRNRKASIVAGVERLETLVRAAGFPDYRTFMYEMLPREVAAREAALGRRDLRALRPDGASGPLVAVLDACAGANDYLRAMVDRLAAYGATAEQLAHGSRSFDALAEDVRLFALNAVLGTARLDDAACLGVVADGMRTRSSSARPAIDALTAAIVDTAALLRDMAFRVAAAMLLTEMMATYAAELLRRPHGDAAQRQLALLAYGVVDATERLCDAHERLVACAGGLPHSAARLDRELAALHVLEVNGRIEAARSDELRRFAELFQAVGVEISAARERVTGLAGAQRELGAGDLRHSLQARDRAHELRSVVDAPVAATA